MGTPPLFSAVSIKGNYFCDFLIASLEDKVLFKGANIFPLRIDLLYKGGNNYVRVIFSMKLHPFTLSAHVFVLCSVLTKTTEHAKNRKIIACSKD